MRGVLDFSAMRRYRMIDILRKRLVYAEFAREVEREAYRAAFYKLSWFIPVAENRTAVARSAEKMYKKFIDVLSGDESTVDVSTYQDIWEKYWGVKIDSAEWREEERRILLDRKMRADRKTGQ